MQYRGCIYRTFHHPTHTKVLGTVPWHDYSNVDKRTITYAKLLILEAVLLMREGAQELSRK